MKLCRVSRCKEGRQRTEIKCKRFWLVIVCPAVECFETEVCMFVPSFVHLFVCLLCFTDVRVSELYGFPLRCKMSVVLQYENKV